MLALVERRQHDVAAAHQTDPADGAHAGDAESLLHPGAGGVHQGSGADLLLGPVGGAQGAGPGVGAAPGGD